MWRVPGYGDVLAELDPTLRERHDQDWVPAGFSDAIGWMAEPPVDGVPRWAVTFSVDDADAVVERAVAGGADVLVAPHDDPPVRSAVLRDPQGAVFGVSAFDPG